MSKAIEVGTPEWARFEDWIKDALGKYSAWVTVAELEDYAGITEKPFSEMKATLSYLAKYDHEILRSAFQYDGWDVQYDQGKSYLEDADEGLVFRECLGGVSARVFVTLKEAIGPYPAEWKLWPTFENYFDLRSDKNGNLVDPYSGELVVIIPSPAKAGPVQVRTDYLQDYLAARKMVLIRQHDHRRHWLQPLSGVSDYEGDGCVHQEKWGCYRLDVVNSGTSSIDRFSRVVGKDIVTPYERAGTVGGKRESAVSTDEYPEFITSKGIDGKEIRQKPNPNDILYPTFFNPKVLKRYYDEPSRYSVGFHSPGMGGVSFLDQWSIPIGRNDEGLMVAWLGDLAKAGLSYDEVVHWRAHNVPPRGGMAMDFWNSQMMCDPPKQPSIESRLIDCRYHITKALASKNKIFWNPYHGPDIHTEKALRLPLFEEHGEFRECILVLAKMFIEYLNVDSFKKELPGTEQIGQDGKSLGPIVLACRWLEKIVGVDGRLAESIKKSLQKIQMVRSKTGVAHRFSDGSYQEVTKRLGIADNVSAKALFAKVAELLAEDLEELCESMGLVDQIWWLKNKKI